jgi:hypothetical protein
MLYHMKMTACKLTNSARMHSSGLTQSSKSSLISSPLSGRFVGCGLRDRLGEGDGASKIDQ